MLKDSHSSHLEYPEEVVGLAVGFTDLGVGVPDPVHLHGHVLLYVVVDPSDVVENLSV